MDGEVKEQDDFYESSSRNITFGQFFEEWFPFYLSIGMTYEQYWVQDSSLVIHYFKAHTIRRDEKNYFAWLSGFYNYLALDAVMSNFGAGLVGKKGHGEYLKEPHPIREKTEEEIEAEKEQKRRRFVMQLNKFHARMEARKNAEHN